ncbi:uncharacterized protein SAPINGB_P004199 [Magnusiomyces paraingens]|uniref:Peptide hydrolase n=1 Tax=Magnusiomyces paraingens TaxID=2606893 RepID=A0A5E8BVD7_9ASCO|nr:uncharacterized protein SAPINGB_P004199 [Saprochaete ingens]VVT54684.1 unnamed protein product [Saprochaete ingens]
MKITQSLIWAIPATALVLPVPITSSQEVLQHVLNSNPVKSVWNWFTGPSDEKRVLETEGGVMYIGGDLLKIRLKRRGINFMDVTDHLDFYAELEARKETDKPETKESPYPTSLQYLKEAGKLLGNISEANMQLALATMSSFKTRYYKSEYGRNASLWLAEAVDDIAKLYSGANITVQTFKHPWGQKSVIATLPGSQISKASSGMRTPATMYHADGDIVVVSAHLDSTNLLLPGILPAPGADDNGSGSVTILEVLRVLASAAESGTFIPHNSLQFHWYSAEEGGLLGSQAVLNEYRRRGVAVRALLQQDMTGFPGMGVGPDREGAAFGVMTDYVDLALTRFVESVVAGYTSTALVRDKCGYGCSDHASATKVGYPSAFVMESAMKKSNPYIHSVMDTIDRLSFEHMAEHARLTLGYAYELAMHKF